MSYSYYLGLFLKTEITCIPQFIDKYAGKYYNNALGNGASWLFLMWYLLHYSYAVFVKGLLKKMSYKSYMSSRYNQSLWYLGFYAIAFVYCSASLFQNDFLNLYKLLLPIHSGNLAGNYLLGFILLITFYLHCTVWELLHTESYLVALNYLLTSVVMMCAYFMRSIETAFVITVLISIIRVSMELSRIIYLMNSYGSDINALFSKTFFGFSIALSAIIYCIILPANLFVPLSIKLFHEPTFENAGFLLCLILWIGSEFLASPSFRIIKHWLDHDDPSASNDCPKCIVECSLFLPRDDELHIIMLYRQEMKERQEKLISLRKPKGRGMLLQTLKCMVAIKRKINKKRISESSDSDESEKSDIDNNDYENKDTDENIESDDELESETNLIQRNDHEESAEKVVNGKLQIRVAESKHGEDAN